MLAARALLRRQPLRLAPLRRTNASLSAAASGIATSTTPPTAAPPTPKPATVKPTSSPSLAKPAVQARANTSASSSGTSKSNGTSNSKGASAGNAGDNAAKKASRKNRKRRKNKGAAFTRALRARRTRWRPPLAPGTLPVYDLALRYIARDAAKLRIELGNARRELAALEKAKAEIDVKGGSAVNEERLEELREKVRVLEVQSEVNRPVVRWMAFRGRGT